MEGTDWAGRKVAAGRGREEGMAAWMAGRDEERREGVVLGEEGQEG